MGHSKGGHFGHFCVCVGKNSGPQGGGQILILRVCVAHLERPTSKKWGGGIHFILQVKKAMICELQVYTLGSNRGPSKHKVLNLYSYRETRHLRFGMGSHGHFSKLSGEVTCTFLKKKYHGF